MNFKQTYGDLVKYLDNGRNQVVGRITGTITLVITFATYLTVTGTTIGLEQVIIFSILSILGMIVIGYGYSKFGLFSAEVSSRTQDSPEFMETLRNTRQILEQLEKK